LTIFSGALIFTREIWSDSTWYGRRRTLVCSNEYKMHLIMWTLHYV